MTLERLEIGCFRNLKNQLLHLDKPWVCVFGKNAQGKSNLLEAASVLVNGRTYRDTAASAVPHEGEYWSVRGRLNGQERIAAFTADGLSLTIDGSRSRVQDFTRTGGGLYIDDNLFWRWFNVADERRKFLDRILFLRESTYLSRYQTWQRLLQQRNAALRSHESDEVIGILTDQYIEAAADLNERRHELMIELGRGLDEKIASWNSQARLHYPHYGAEGYRRLHTRFRQNEMRRGHSLFGPQREDLTLLLDGKPSTRILSLGQKKCHFLCLCLAAAELTPNAILMIDDFDTDLDTEWLGKITSLFDASPVQKVTAGLTPHGERCQMVRIREGRLFHEEGTQ